MTLNRREILALLAAVGCAPYQSGEDAADGAEGERSGRFRLAVCNETFQGWSVADGFRGAFQTGYTGVEIAPFTLSDDPASVSASQRKEYRDIMESEGLDYVGLHSLLTAPRGELHVTTPDEALRNRSWDYFRRLVDLCADLGDGGMMIFGSGRQRRTVDGSSVEDATRRLRDGLAGVADHCSERGVMVLPETLAPHLCDVLTSLDQTVAMVREIGHPAVQTMFDTHNAVAEEVPHDQLIKQHADLIHHVHINEMDGRHPGTGSYDFSVPMQALKDIGYTGWLSLEVFQFEPSGEEIARASSRYLRDIEATLRPA
ncbi:MAG: sugar phosphate isomerase/epimerase [Bryobacterales bacterium]|nr:sugar phosphate isomerase/epimerase [Bryobacterales bacterium]